MACELREEVNRTDWEKLYNEGQTKFRVEWVASEERCEILRRLITKYKAKRVLEVGACCGLASLSMAEVLPDDGEVVALEIDQYLADLGQKFLDKSKDGAKVKYMIGPAMDSLKEIAKKCFDGKAQPFDFLMIDADRAGMMDYFNLFWWESPNLLGERATVCIDITPYKGQSAVLTRGPSSGDLQGDLWVVPSGQDQIDSVRRTLEASTEHTVYKVADLLVSHTRDKGNRDETDSHLSTPRRDHAGGPWRPRGSGYPVIHASPTSPVQSPSLTHGANPLASFPNDHLRAVGAARWVPPKPSDPVAELRKATQEANWGKLYEDAETMTRVESVWMSSPERCTHLRKLIQEAGAKRILEIGGSCGIASLSMAEALPGNGQLVSLEVDPFLVNFGKSMREKSPANHKIACKIGTAMESLKCLEAEVRSGSAQPFDFVIIDADRAHMLDYFQFVWDKQDFLAAGSIVCVDIQQYKGQLPVRYQKHGKAPEADQWVLPSGQEQVDHVKKLLETSSRFSHYKLGGMVVVKQTGLQDLTI
jgi:predicted O-methyltransferase YrrM